MQGDAINGTPDEPQDDEGEDEEVDPTTGLAVKAIAGASKVGTSLVQRVLGPTADLLGKELQGWAEKRLQNVGDIVENAAGKLPSDIDPMGSVPSRVLGKLIVDGSFCDDPVSVEYLGGVLASSRTGISRDDRGAALTALISRISSYELRTHYIIYKTVQSFLIGVPDLHLRLSRDRHEYGRLYIPHRSYVEAMEFDSSEDWAEVLTHCLNGLTSEGLIGATWASNDAGFLAEMLHVNPPPAPGVMVEMSLQGIYLFSWAFGFSDDPVGRFLDASADYELTPPLKPPAGAMLVRDILAT